MNLHDWGVCGRRMLIVLSILALSAIECSAQQAETAMASEYFYETLAADGAWVDHPSYGRVWRPSEISDGWRPYTYGRWVWTAEYGWVWVSEERWGWATYHYGTWVWTSEHGWVWVPGEVWGPAWVDWCWGDGYVGWSPMPPDGGWREYVECRSPSYRRQAVFVAEAHFTAPRMSLHALPAANNAWVGAGAVHVSGYAKVDGVIVNRGIDVVRLRAVTGQQVKPVRIVAATQPVTAIMAPSLREVRIYRPELKAARPSTRENAARQRLILEPGRELAPPIGGQEIGSPPLDTQVVREPPTISVPGGLAEPPPTLGGGPFSPGGPLGGLRGKIGR